METFCISPPKDFVADDIWLLAVPFFETTNSIFNITLENINFSITTPGHWNSESAEKTIDQLINLLEFRSQSAIELHVQQVRKKG